MQDFDFSGTHRNSNIYLWGRKKCDAGGYFHPITEIICKINREGVVCKFRGRNPTRKSGIQVINFLCQNNFYLVIEWSTPTTDPPTTITRPRSTTRVQNHFTLTSLFSHFKVKWFLFYKITSLHFTLKF